MKKRHFDTLKKLLIFLKKIPVCRQTNGFCWGKNICKMSRNRYLADLTTGGVPTGVISGQVGVGPSMCKKSGQKSSMFFSCVQNCILIIYLCSRIEIGGLPFIAQNMGVRKIPPKWPKIGENVQKWQKYEKSKKQLQKKK